MKVHVNLNREELYTAIRDYLKTRGYDERVIAVNFRYYGDWVFSETDKEWVNHDVEADIVLETTIDLNTEVK